MHTAWRLVETRFCGDPLDGEGARRYGGRWNSSGNRVVYAADSLALATLEVMVHLEDYEVLINEFSCVKLQIPEDLVEAVSPLQLSPEWHVDANCSETRPWGDEWIQSARGAVLAVPSAVIPEERNFLLNPTHPDFRRIIVGELRPFQLDSRLAR